MVTRVALDRRSEGSITAEDLTATSVSGSDQQRLLRPTCGEIEPLSGACGLFVPLRGRLPTESFIRGDDTPYRVMAPHFSCYR